MGIASAAQGTFALVQRKLKNPEYLTEFLDKNGKSDIASPAQGTFALEQQKLKNPKYLTENSAIDQKTLS